MITIPNLPTIAEGAKATRSIATFSRLLTSVGLEKLLQSEGHYTLFAPTDQAFDDLPPGALQTLESDPAELRAMVEYHILEVGRELEQLSNAKLPTLQGALITASVTDDGMQLDHANTRGFPLRCSNGVIHQIDAVLFPGFTPELSAKARAESAWSGKRRASRLPALAPTTAAQDAEALFETPTQRPAESA